MGITLIAASMISSIVPSTIAVATATATACAPHMPSSEWLTEASISDALYTAGQSDPDLIVRSAGELRLSNFLTWQSVYSELYFTDTLWPDFSDADVDAAVEAYYARTRRFGGLK